MSSGVKKPSGKSAEAAVARYRNGGTESVVAGFRYANDTAAIIWAYVA